MNNDWITNRPFIPDIGTCYEIAFGNVTYQGKTGHWTSKIKANGNFSGQWIDLDTGKALDAELAKYVVQAFRVIERDQ